MAKSHTASPSRATSVALRVENIRKSFGDNVVLKDASFELHEKEILGVIGPSGGGKSTLLRCLNFLENIDSGKIEYPGHIAACVDEAGTMVIRDSSDRVYRVFSEQVVSLFRRKVGFVFQSFNLWDERTVMDNLTLAPRVVLGTSQENAEGEARQLCRQYGLGAKLNARAWELSGGQRQRVAILRALMMHPGFMLLDEITSALDPVLTVEVMEAIEKLRDKGLTMIVVTHHIEFASSLCDRIMFLSRGEVVQIDTPSGLRQSPATDEVGRFLEVLRSAR